MDNLKEDAPKKETKYLDLNGLKYFLECFKEYMANESDTEEKTNVSL